MKACYRTIHFPETSTSVIRVLLNSIPEATMSKVNVYSASWNQGLATKAKEVLAPTHPKYNFSVASGSLEREQKPRGNAFRFRPSDDTGKRLGETGASSYSERLPPPLSSVCSETSKAMSSWTSEGTPWTSRGPGTSLAAWAHSVFTYSATRSPLQGALS